MHARTHARTYTHTDTHTHTHTHIYCIYLYIYLYIYNVTTLAGLGPVRLYLHASFLCIYNTRRETGVALIGRATRALIRRQSGELWIPGIWLSLDRDWFWILVGFGLASSLVLNY